MNFYKRHIGDYIKDAGHLTLLEHGVYTRLLDVYYTREEGIPQDKAARLTGARSKDEVQALDNVLEEFFTLDGGLWIQNRCEAEIEAASQQADANRNNGKKGGRPKRNTTEQKPNGLFPGLNSESENNLSQTPDSRLQTLGSKTDSSSALVPEYAEDDDRLPPRPSLAPSGTPTGRAVGICTLLTGAGITKVTAFHPDIAVTWAQDERVTDMLLLAAVKRARESMGDKPVQVNYLRPIIVELLNPPAMKPGPAALPAAKPRKPQGMDHKGLDESYDDYQARISKAEAERRKGQTP
jgi:uncharacterized protein YdaU (DUF1376 family)